MLLVTKDNSMERFLKSEDAADDMVLACHPRTGLLVIDIDSPHLLKRARVVEDRWPGGLSIVKWLTGGVDADDGSGPFARQHWVVVIPQGITTKNVADELVSSGIDRDHLRDSRRKSRYPLSPHRSGGYVKLLEPATVDQACELLHGACALDGFEELEPPGTESFLDNPNPRRNSLTALAEDLISHGRGDKYDTTHGALMALAHSLVSAGWDGYEYMAAVLQEDCPLLDSWLKRDRGIHGEVIRGWNIPSDKYLKQIIGTWNRAVQMHGADPRIANTDSLQHAWEVWQWVDRAEGFLFAQPTTRATDRQVLEALGRMLAEHHSWTVLPGKRGLGVEAGVSSETAMSALHRLEGYGAIELGTVGEGMELIHARPVRVNRAWLVDTTLAHAGWFPNIDSPDSFLPVRSDVWNRGCLGMAALRVYVEATRGWVTVAELVQSTGQSRDSVITGLKKLNTAEAQLGVELMLEKGGTVVAVPLPKPWIVEKELLHRFNMGRGTVVQRVERAAERVFSERTANKNTRERIRGIRSAQA